MSSHRPFVLGVLVLALAGCTAEPDPAPLPTGPSREALLDALERDTGSRWVSSTGANEGVHDPQLLVPVGHVHLPGTTGTDRATRFVARYASLLGGRAEDLGSARLETATGTEGETTIVSFRHRIPGWVRLLSSEVEWKEIGHLTLFKLGFRTGSGSGISPPA